MSNNTNRNYITVSELSKRVNKSQQWIYKMIETRPQMKPFVRVIDGKKMVHKSAIWKVFGVGVEDANENDLIQESPETPEEQMIKFLQSQLEERAKEIATLHEMLQRNQIMLSVTQQRLYALEDMQRPSPEADNEQPKAPEDPEPTPTQEPVKVPDPEPPAQQRESLLGRLSRAFRRRV